LISRSLKYLIFCVSIIFFFVCCVPSQPVDLEPSEITVTYEMPVVRILEGYSELQEKEGISISVVPGNFTKMKLTRTRCDWVGTSLERLIGKEENDVLPDAQTYYKVVRIPYYEIQPENLIFNIKIYNHLDRVLRLAGTIVAFQVDGKMIHVDKANYQEFIDGFIIPRQEAEYQIYGPAINTISDTCNVALLLYDIVTKTDEAGNPTKKSNFEWYFNYKNTMMSERVKENVVGRTMTPVQARALERSGIR